MQINREQLLQNTITGLLTAVAVVYAAGKRAGAYYFENQEEINADLATFVAAVRTGFVAAYQTTYQLGADARVAYSKTYPVVAPKVTELYNKALVCHNGVSDYLRSKLNLN